MFLTVETVMPWLGALYAAVPELESVRPRVTKKMREFMEAYERIKDPKKCPKCQRAALTSQLSSARRELAKLLFQDLLEAPASTRGQVAQVVEEQLGVPASIIYAPQGGVLYKK